MRRAPNFIKNYPDDALLEEVRRAAGLVDRPVLTMSDFAKHSGVGVNAIARRFGGWQAVLE
ncbi:MAG: homing endonuclease associated repeat-containing protein [Armatimonadota bacterium]